MFCPPVWRWPRVIAPRLSSRRAMVEIKRFCAFTSVVTGRNRGGSGAALAKAVLHAVPVD